MGDFNYKKTSLHNYTVSGGDLNVAMFLDSVTDCSLFQHVQNPTQFRTGIESYVLGLIFTNEKTINNLNYTI